MRAIWAILALLMIAHPATASEVEAPGPEGPLKGTLLTPDQRPIAATAIIIPGSGPTDRDGNNPLGVAAATYRLLAEALANRGIASVRIDKRGMFASKPAIKDANDVTIAAYAADVSEWIKTARGQTGAPCVWLIGHSEGGLVALAAAQNRKHICGLVLVAAAGRPLGSVLREQLAANPANAPVLEQANAAIAALEAGNRVDPATLHPALLGLFNPAVQGFLISALSYDPADLIARTGKPVLIVQGTSDLQVSVDNAERLKAAAPRAELALLADVNHVLKSVPPGDRSANIATYANPDLPLAEGVAEAIAAFIKRAR
jgi:hypothetical protein